MRKKHDSKIKKFRRTVRKLRHSKKGIYIGGEEEVVMAKDLLNAKMARINEKALITFDKSLHKYNEAKSDLDKAKKKLEEAENQKKIDTDENDKYYAFISEERMKGDEDNLYEAKQELYKAEDKFEETENKYIGEQAHKEACELYKTKKANLTFLGEEKVSELILSDLTLIMNKTEHAYRDIHNNEMKPARKDYEIKESDYKEKLNKVIKMANANTKRGVFSLFSTKDKDKDRDREALYKYYKGDNNIKEEVEEYKIKKNIARLKYEKYAYLEAYLRQDYVDVEAKREPLLAQSKRDRADRDRRFERMTREVEDELRKLTPEQLKLENARANRNAMEQTSGDRHGPDAFMSDKEIAEHIKEQEEREANISQDSNLTGGHKKNNTKIRRNKKRRRNTKKQLIMKRK
jgi:hypothetical protein